MKARSLAHCPTRARNRAAGKERTEGLGQTGAQLTLDGSNSLVGCLLKDDAWPSLNAG
jgi:hypothetical protein